jgi:thiol:disulfide interchange protein DsbD
MTGILSGMNGNIDASWPTAILFSYAGGVLASFTPCVYPLIPITTSYVISRSGGVPSRSRAFFLSLAYVTGLSLTYAGLGFFAALTGSFFGSIATNPLTLLLVGLFISMMALGMLEVVSVPVPGFMSGGSASAGSGLFGAFTLGLVSGFVAGPCTAPALAVLLTYVVREGNPVFGAVLLFVFSFGMGSLLIVLGSFSGLAGRLPKSGAWMTKIKTALGILMLGMGDYFIFQAGRQWL